MSSLRYQTYSDQILASVDVDRIRAILEEAAADDCLPATEFFDLCTADIVEMIAWRAKK